MAEGREAGGHRGQGQGGRWAPWLRAGSKGGRARTDSFRLQSAAVRAAGATPKSSASVAAAAVSAGPHPPPPPGLPNLPPLPAIGSKLVLPRRRTALSKVHSWARSSAATPRAARLALVAANALASAATSPAVHAAVAFR